MTSHTNFKEGEIYQVKQGEKTYDAVFLKTYKNDKYSFIFGDNLLDSDYPLTVDGKPMLIASARECANPKWMKLWNTTTNKTASLHERIVFKFPEESKTKAKKQENG